VETAGEMMTKIIERNTQIPCRKTQTFSTFADGQTAVRIKVYEGERARTRDNNLLGNFELSGIAPAPRGVPRIEVTFDMDTNGILNVAAEDKGTGRKNKITITNESGRLTSDQIKKMVADAERYKADDEVANARIQAKNHLESYVFSLRNTLNDTKFAEKLSADDKKALEGAVQDCVKWLEANSTAEKEKYEEKQQAVEKICMPIISRLYQGAGGPDAAGMGGMGGDAGGTGGSSGGGSTGGTGGTGGTSGSRASSGPKVEEVD